eukprot:c6438_g1_i1.p1 GENE.c6438_g1_i1~~c6438_g1_i1.p1  ORF type:complete len:335 (+),score=85.27 c6438_g1_i1:57-1007(+)
MSPNNQTAHSFPSPHLSPSRTATTLQVIFSGDHKHVIFFSNFDHWQHGIPMQRLTRSPLPTATPRLPAFFVTAPFTSFRPLLFKFVADDVWTTSPDYPTTGDGQDANNIAMPVLFEYKPHNDITHKCNNNNHNHTSSTIQSVGVLCDADGWQEMRDAIRISSCDGASVSDSRHVFAESNRCVFAFVGLFPVQECYKFKFCVDGEWGLSSRYNSCVEGNNINNVVLCCDSSHIVTDTREGEVGIEFVFRATNEQQQQQVCVRGDAWNFWNESHLLKLTSISSTTIWRAVLPVPIRKKIQFKVGCFFEFSVFFVCLSV